MTILRDTGHFEEALELVEEIKDYTSQAGLGPWSQLGDEARRLQALFFLGRYEEVLQAVEEIRVQMRSLPERGDQNETIQPWNVRESILNIGERAATLSGKYEKALELNAENVGRKKSRGATDLELARFQFNDYGPLLGLEHYDETGELLWECKEVFEREKDILYLGRVFIALADLQYRMGQTDQAIKFGETALRYIYQTDNTEDASISHDNLANSLAKAGSDKVLAHCLAAGIINYLTSSGGLTLTLQNLSIHLSKLGSQALPSSFDQLCRIVEEVAGVRFRELFIRLAGPEADGDQVMQKVIEMARASPTV